MTDYSEDLVDALKATANRLGKHLPDNMLAKLRAYAAQRMEHLAQIVGQPGFEQAVEAEAQNVGMMGSIQAVSAADAVDAELKGIIVGALTVAARALGGAA
jgi:hypothetical protein